MLPPLDYSGFTDLGSFAAGSGLEMLDIRFIGNSAIGDEQLRLIAQPYLGRHLNYNALSNLRDEISLAYINSGYVTSGAIIAARSLNNGILTVEIREGQLGDITISSEHFRSGTLLERLGIASGDIVNVQTIEEQIRQVQRDPRISRVNAQLAPTRDIGRSDLTIAIEENPPLNFYSGYSNSSSPSVGSDTSELLVQHRNLLGYGDTLGLRALDTEGLDVVDFSYQLPVNARQGSLLFSARKSDSRVVDEAFAGLDIRGVSESAQVGFRQPILLGNQDEIDLSLVSDFKRASSSLLGEGFSFSPGAEDGETRIAAIRLGAEWHRRSVNQVISLRSQLSVGINAFDATSHEGPIPDSQFTSLLVQGQWARQLQNSPWELRARINLQLIDSPVPGLEQFVIGGQSSVRGYRQNLLVRDSGVNASFEARYPLLRRQAFELSGALFSDLGHGRNVNREANSENLAALGLGIHITAWQRVNLSLEWAEALSDVKIIGEPDRQDDGLHFRIGLRWAL